MENNKIYSAMINCMRDVGAIGKEKRNQQQGFMYRGIDDVMNALNPAMAKNGVFVAPEVIGAEYAEKATRNGGAMEIAKLTVKYTFYADDGSSVRVTTIGEAMDSADKRTNKAMAIALKYACFQAFMIPTEEMEDADPDKYSPQPEAPQKAAKSAQKAPALKINKGPAPKAEPTPAPKNEPAPEQQANAEAERDAVEMDPRWQNHTCEHCGKPLTAHTAAASFAACKGHYFCDSNCRSAALILWQKNHQREK